MIPRDQGLRTCYRANKLRRAKCKIHGAWAFGLALRLWVLEETSYHGSAMTHELLAATLEDVMSVCDERGMARCDTVVIVGDNTVKELKNSVCLLYAANLVNHYKLRPFGFNSQITLILLYFGGNNFGCFRDQVFLLYVYIVWNNFGCFRDQVFMRNDDESFSHT